jgi:microcystin-dependent protein
VTEPFVGEIRIFGFNFAPIGWALCNGQLLPISQNTALFSLLGTTYGGNGTSNFALPNLQGRIPIHQGTGAGLSPYVIGQTGGTESTTLTVGELPAHNHPVNAHNGVGTLARPAASVPARSSAEAYAPAPDGTTMDAGMIGDTGSGQPFNNLQPYLVLNVCISLLGIFPSRN